MNQNLFFTPTNILLNSSAEKNIFLKHNAYHFTKRFKVIFLNVNTVNEHFTLRCVIKTWNKINKA